MKTICTLLLSMVFGLSAGAESAIWKITSADKPFYLAGSCHVLKKSHYPLPAEYEKAYTEVKQLYFETDLDNFNMAKVQKLMARAAMLTNGKTLQTSLSEDTWKQLAAYAEKTGLPLDKFQVFKPWMVTFMIMMTELQKQGIDPMHGLDMYFSNKARADGKTVGGLETPEAHVHALSAFDEALSEDMVKSTLEQVDQLAGEAEKLVNAWRAGDMKKIDGFVSGSMRQEYPDLYKRLLVDRNRNWVPDIEKLIQSGVPTMIVVGAGHLVGEDSVNRMLEAKGHRIEQYRLE
ncbi:MAG: TraB/GumN family protein, partial [Verrucomicrobiota bacterium]